MAQLFLIKDGSPHQATAPRAVNVETLAEKLTPFEKRYFDAPPDINPAHGPAADEDEYRHVIVKVDEGELNAVFPDAGYYHIPHLTPDDCETLFGLKDARRH